MRVVVVFCLVVINSQNGNTNDTNNDISNDKNNDGGTVNNILRN